MRSSTPQHDADWGADLKSSFCRKRRAQRSAKTPFLMPKAAWPSGPRRSLQAPACNGVGLQQLGCHPCVRRNAALRIAGQDLAWRSKDNLAEWSTAAGPIGGLGRREFKARRGDPSHCRNRSTIPSCRTSCDVATTTRPTRLKVLVATAIPQGRRSRTPQLPTTSRTWQRARSR